MAGEKVPQVIKRVRKLTKLVLQDPKNANLLLDLLNFSQSENDEIVCASCHSLVQIFSHFISTQCFVDIEKTSTVAEADLSKEDQFSSWLKEQFSTACGVLTDHLSHDSSHVQITALQSLITLLHVLGKDCPHGFSDKLIEGIVSHLLSMEFDQEKLIQILPSLLEAWEDSTYISSVCLMHIKKILTHMGQPASNIMLFNCWRMIKQLSRHNIDGKLKRQLTGIVCEFLKHRMPTNLYRELLTGIGSVMEKMSSPLRLTDFLTESFNLGGAISLMSLHGLFILMHKYNLDYPAFYTKLYSMFEPQVFGAKYRARFFHLAETFLSSTHLPAYLVAAFAKRLARLCLHAPVSGAYIAVPFILNLISHHPACDILLHRTEGSTELDTDPFLPNETDPLKCRAMDSCLWELQALEHHYDPSLSQKAQKRQIAEEDLSLILENTSNDIIFSEAKKIKKDVPVTFERPRGLELFYKFVL